MADRRHYELMMIVDPRLEDASIQQAIERYLDIVRQRGGDVTKVDHWGRRRLAFEMKHLNEGYYAVADLQADPAAVAELERVLRLADEVVRHKVVRPGKD
ncbi:MAG: 30S ribosomal protein S6 [Acidobacteria bacterium]|nr:30S ribosomal protein S6 [Acidobacteriota bacterium]